MSKVYTSSDNENPLTKVDRCYSGPALTSWEQGRLDAFGKGENGQLLHWWFKNGQWSDREDLGGKLKGDPAAVSWGPHRIDVVVRGMDDCLWHRACKTSGRTEWVKLGNYPIHSSPALCSRGEGQLDCFACSSQGEVLHRVYQNGSWGDWFKIDETIVASKPTAVASGEYLFVAAEGTDGHIWTTRMSYL